MKKLLTVLVLGLAGGLFAAFGTGNTIILSGWPVADTSVTAETAEITLEASGAAVASATLTDFDGRAFAMDVKAFEGDFTSSPIGLMMILK